MDLLIGFGVGLVAAWGGLSYGVAKGLVFKSAIGRQAVAKLDALVAVKPGLSQAIATVKAGLVQARL